jgi:predicted phosphodiesterase
MLIAFISDIHGNLPALEAAVEDATSRGAEQIICAGDMTGYGPFPDDVCNFLQKWNIPSIIGNYDRKVIWATKRDKSTMKEMKAKKLKILLWTVEHTGKQSIGYLTGLPAHIDFQLPTGHKALVAHGSPLSANDTIYPSITRQGLETKLGDAHPDLLVCGHTHIPFVRHLGGILVVNCGSVGHPVDGDPRPSYALVRTEKSAETHGNIIRFDYDRERTIAEFKKTGLPKALRKDFAEGNKRRFLE